MNNGTVSNKCHKRYLKCEPALENLVPIEPGPDEPVQGILPEHYLFIYTKLLSK